MGELQRIFVLTDALAPAELAGRLQEQGNRFVLRPPELVRVTLYDTFDWRLHAAGLVLAEESGAHGTATRLLRRRDGAVLARVPQALPALAADFPPGPAAARVAREIGIRALLPLAVLQLQRHPLELRDERGKLRLRLIHESGSASLPGATQRQPLPPRVQLAGVRGYPAPFVAVARRLAADPACAPAPGDLLALVEPLLPRRPGQYAPRPDVPLQGTEPAGAALQAILRHLLDIVAENLAGTVQDLDSEFLHDLRVAVRRSRSALGLFRQLFVDPPLTHLRSELQWLQQATGPVRDLDVARLTLPAAIASLPAAARNDLEPLARFLAHQRQRERRVLTRHLRSARCRRLLAEWRAWLAQSGPDTLTDAARPPIGLVARRRIRKTLHRFLVRGRAIGPDSPDSQLHRLRINGKKLRYLLEFFRPLFPAEACGAILTRLKAIQEFLGNLQDLAVQQDQLREYGRRMSQEGSADAACLLAMGRLVEELERRRACLRQEFPVIFRNFDRGRTRRLLSTLLAVEME